MEIQHYHLTARDWRWLKKAPSDGSDILVWHDIRLTDDDNPDEERKRLGEYLRRACMWNPTPWPPARSP